MPQNAFSDLVKLEVLYISRDDRPMCVRNVRDERTLLLELWQCIQGCHHPSLCGCDARDHLRDLIAIRRCAVINHVDNNVLDLALQLRKNVS